MAEKELQTSYVKESTGSIFKSLFRTQQPEFVRVRVEQIHQ